MDTTKHSDFFNPEEHKKTISIIGAGAIGSNTAWQLVRLGFGRIRIYDFDEIEQHNITNQTYNQEDIGKKKTEALKESLLKINPDATITTYDRWTPETEPTAIIIIAVDSIELRKQIIETYEMEMGIDLIIDMRIGLQEAQMYAAKPPKMERILSTMQFKDDDVNIPVSACGTQLTVLPTIQSIVSMSVMNLINFLKTGDYAYQIITDTIQGITKSYR